MRKWIAALALVGCVALSAPDASEAQVVTGGLVNVTLVDVIDVGDVDVTILENVGIGVAANVAAQICGLQVGSVGIIAQQVARQGQYTVCRIEGQDGDQDVVIRR